MNPEVYRCKIGDFECTIFKDFMFKYLAKDFFTNADEKELGKSLTKHNLSPDNIPSPFIAMLLQDGDRKILIDSSIGFSEDPILFRGKEYLRQRPIYRYYIPKIQCLDSLGNRESTKNPQLLGDFIVHRFERY